MYKSRVTVETEEDSSPNKFSKTFGRDKALDAILSASSDDKELLANLGKDNSKNDLIEE